MPLRAMMNDPITVQRGGTEKSYMAYVQGRSIFLPEDADVRRGDSVRWSGYHEEHKVVKSELARAPGGGRLSHVEVKVVPVSEWSEPAERQSVVHQVIHSAGSVAGHDIHSTVNNFTVTQLFQSVELALAADAAIPQEEKASIIQRLRSLAENPYVSNLSAAAIYEFLKNLATRS